MRPLAVGLRHAPDDGLRDSAPARGFDDAATVPGNRLRRRARARRVGAVSPLHPRAAPDLSVSPDAASAATPNRSSRAARGPPGCKPSCRPLSSCATRRDAGLLSDHGQATARGRLLAQLGRLIDKAPTLDAADRFAAHLDREFPAAFTFLWDPSIDATNWRAEQAIRPAVVTRKVCGGNRTRRGADTQQVLASVVRTALPASTRPRPADHHDASLSQAPSFPTRSNGRPR